MYAGPYKYILEIKVYIDGTDGMDDEFEDLQDWYLELDLFQ